MLKRIKESKHYTRIRKHVLRIQKKKNEETREQTIKCYMGIIQAV